jgi:hypothetical protein
MKYWFISCSTGGKIVTGYFTSPHTWTYGKLYTTLTKEKELTDITTLREVSKSVVGSRELLFSLIG